MGKLKRIRVTPKKSILHKGKEVYRTAADAREAAKIMTAYVPRVGDHDLVELMAANNMLKKDVVEYFGIGDDTFTKLFGENFERGKVRKNMKVTQTLFDAAVGHQGLYDTKKRKWIVRPRGPDQTALIWWDKTRGGWREGSDVTLKGKGLTLTTKVVVYMPPNGREAGAGGDPTFVVREAAKVIDGTFTEKKAKA